MNELSSTVRVLAVSPNESDLTVLSRIIDHSAWTFDAASGVNEARQHLNSHCTHVVVCDSKLPDGDWKDMLEAICSLPDAPQLIVTSRDADDRLWAEVLNCGAWDVLNKPYHPKEVYQTVHLAWRHWQDRSRGRVETRRRSAASAGAERPFANYA